MWKYQSPDELYHVGVLGMKWGRRKARKEANIEKTRISNINEIKRSKYGKTSTHLYGEGAAKTAIGGAVTSVGVKLATKGKTNTGALLVGLGTLQSVSGLVSIGKSFVNNRTLANKTYKAQTKQLKAKYGKLEDQYTYGKNANKAKNARIDKQLASLERQIKNR